MGRGDEPEARRGRSAGRTVLMGQRLWRQAERDLEIARMTLQPRAYYVAANLAHQAAEKSLKAGYWHLRGEEPTWTHDLGKCAEQVAERAGGLPPEVDAAIAQLEPMFERSRYPSGKVDEPIPADLIGVEDAQMAIRSAEAVMVWVRMLLQRLPGRTRRKRSC